MDDLLEEAKFHAAEVVKELRTDLSEEQINHIAEAVGVSASEVQYYKGKSR